MIDSDHPSIVSAVTEIVGDAVTDREKAVRIHNYVRDSVKFGFSTSYYEQKASEVLVSKKGIGHTKATLFIALLHACNIPARQHFVNLNSAIIRDFLSVQSNFVDHSFVEVCLQGHWYHVDSYVVDRDFADGAKLQLKAEGRIVGYGIHLHGTSDWDGTSDAFCQLVNDGSFPDLITRDYGLFLDVDAFYQSGNGEMKLNFMRRIVLKVYLRLVNQAIDSFRRKHSQGKMVEKAAVIDS